MIRSRTLVAFALIAACARAQAPQFRVLDYPLPADAFSEAVADLDGDGDVDLLNQYGIYVNDGHARFTGPVPCLLSFPRKRTLLADLNGDGLPDCMSIDGFNALRIDFNLGGLVFTGPTFGPQFPAGYIPAGLSAADVDLDGDTDVLISLQQPPPAQQSGPPALWLNDGSGAFVQAPRASFPAASYQATLTQDLDGNGYADALLAYGSPNLIVAFNVGGVFTISPSAQWNMGLYSAVTASDFNGDGLVDLAVAFYFGGNGPAVNFNSPTGFTGFPAPTGGAVSGLRAIDVDGDGADEILAQNYDQATYYSYLSLHAVGSNGLLGPALQSFPGVAFESFWGYAPVGQENVRDLDGDGDLDVIVVDGRTPALLMNTGIGALVTVGGHAPGISMHLPQVGNVNGDGISDLLGFRAPLSSASSAFITGINDGNGFFQVGVTTTLSLPPPYPTNYSLYAFDRDGDGDSDIFAAANFLTGGCPGCATPPDVIFDNVGGTFVQTQTLPGNGATVACQAFDFDSDGDQDILLGRRNYTFTSGLTGPMRYLRNDGLAGFAAATTIGASHATYDLDLGDFDGNGTTDVFQTNYIGGTLEPCVAYLNPGNAAFVPVAQNFGGWFTAAGDLNGDGMTDLVVDGTVWFATGGGAFTQGPALPTVLVAPSVLADVDLDGDLDIVETPATIMLNQGGANFAPPVSLLPLVPYVPWGWEIPKSTVVDLDRDGDPDILAPGPVVVSNVARQIAHGSPARLGRPASIDIYGTPGGGWFLFAANGPASIPYPPFGNVLIDPASAFLAAMGTFTGPASSNPGAANLTATVPANPGLAGWTTWWQGFDAVTSKATNSVTITVQSY